MRRLEAWYQKLLGPEAKRGHLYPGFWMLLGGIAVGLSGLGLFLYSESLHGAAYVVWREAAIVLAALSGPLVFLGISFALPARLAVRVVSAGGAVLAGSTLFLFTRHYPHNFNVPGYDRVDHAPLIVSLYLLGMAVLVGGILAQLIGYYVRRNQPSGEEGDAGWEGTDYEVPDWLIQKDIDDAMRLYPASWGDGTNGLIKSIMINVDDALAPGSELRDGDFARMSDLEVPDLDLTSRKVKGLYNNDVDLPDDVAENPAEQLRRLRQLQVKDPKRYLPHKRSWWRSVFRRDRHQRLARDRPDRME